MKIQRLREICCVGLPQLLPLRMNEIRFLKKTYINIYIHILLKKKQIYFHMLNRLNMEKIFFSLSKSELFLPSVNQRITSLRKIKKNPFSFCAFYE